MNHPIMTSHVDYFRTVGYESSSTSNDSNSVSQFIIIKWDSIHLFLEILALTSLFEAFR